MNYIKNIPSLLMTSILIVVSFLTYGQNITQTIRGKVLDRDAKTPLIGVTIIIMHDSTMLGGSVSDTNGNFRVENISIGRHALKVSYLGYREIFIPNIVVNSGKEVVLSLEMDESPITMNEVTISATRKDQAINEMTTVSARTFDVDETMRYAGSREDPARMASNYAGIRGGNDSRNDIIIRGNSPIGVLWRLEDIEIPNPNHFAHFGTTGGPVSILNNKTLGNSDFLTGAFPAEYGNALSGVFDLNLRNGNNEKREHTFQFGFLGVEFLTEGPLSKKNGSSYFAHYRYATLKLFQMAGLEVGVSAVPKYQDFSFKLNFPVKKSGSLSVFGIGGASDISILASELDSADWAFGNKDRDKHFGSSMGVFGVSYMHIINPSTYAKLTVAATGKEMHNQHDSVVLGTDFKKTILFSNLNQGNISASAFINKKFNVKNNLKTGIFFDRIFFDIEDRRFKEHLNDWTYKSNFVGAAYLLQAYTQWKYKIADKLTLNTGVHSQHFFLNNTIAVEPRIGLKWDFNEKQMLSFGYGMHHQTQPIYIYFQQVQNSSMSYASHNKNLDFTRSDHYVLGYDYSLTDNLRLKVEAYYQYLKDVPVEKKVSSYSILNQGSEFTLFYPDTLVNKGTAVNYGIEITTEKFYSKNYFFLVTASLFDSKYTGSDGILRDTDFNSSYIFNVLAGKEFKLGKNKNSSLGLGTKITTSGGRRFTPIDTAASNLANETVRIDSLAFTQQYKDYFRLDLKISWRKNSRKLTHEVSLDIINLLNTKNVLSQTYDVTTNQLRYEYQLELLPVLYYKIDF